MENLNTVEILRVEDNPNDAELIIRGLQKQIFANQVHVVEDEAEVLE